MKQQTRLPFSKGASACAALLLLLGVNCGRATAQQSTGASSTSHAISVPMVSSAPVERELDAFARALSGINSYSATVTIFDQKDAQTQNVVFDYTFSKPSNVTVHVIAGPNAGATLTWIGGPTIVARRGSGIAAMFSKTLSLHDPLVTTLQGASIDELSFGAILLHAQQDVARLSLTSGGTIDGVAANALTLKSSTGSAVDPGLTREIVEMSTATHLPMRVLGYAGSMLVSNVGFSNVKLGGDDSGP